VPLLQPANDFFHAPFVYLYYKNLKFDIEIPAYLSSTILGQEVYVCVTEISNAIKCPCDDQHAQFGEYPPHCDLHFIIREMFGGVYGDTKHTCATRSQLPHNLLLIDYVLKKNVCPLGHKTQRIGDSLAALYAFQEKYWVDVPKLWKQLYKYWEDMVDKRLSSASQSPLPFPCLITKIITESNISFLENVVLDRNIPIFGLAQWNQSISHMPRMVEHQVDKEVDDTPTEEMDVGEQAAPREETVMFVTTNFASLQGQMDRMAIELREMRAQQKIMVDTQTAMMNAQTETMTMMRELLGRHPPPADADT